MRYAAKRNWPERANGWEQHGEAETIEAFALAFAADQGLGVGTQFEVLDKDSDDAALVSFQVTGTNPCTLGPVGALAPAQTGSAPSSAPPFAASALGFFLYMAKVAAIIMVVMGAIMYALKSFNLTPPPG